MRFCFPLLSKRFATFVIARGKTLQPSGLNLKGDAI